MDQGPIRKLTREERGRVAEKVMEWGNLIFIGLVVAQIIPGDKPFNLVFGLIGVLSLVSAYYLAARTMRGGDE